MEPSVLLRGPWGHPYADEALAMAREAGAQPWAVLTLPQRVSIGDVEAAVAFASTPTAAPRFVIGCLDTLSTRAMNLLLKPIEDASEGQARWILWSTKPVIGTLASRLSVRLVTPLSREAIASRLGIFDEVEADRLAASSGGDLAYADLLARGDGVRTQVVSAYEAVSRGDVNAAATIASALYRKPRESKAEAVVRLARFRSELLRFGMEAESGISRGFRDLPQPRITSSGKVLLAGVPREVLNWMFRVLSSPATDDLAVYACLTGAAHRVDVLRASR